MLGILLPLILFEQLARDFDATKKYQGLWRFRDSYGLENEEIPIII